MSGCCMKKKKRNSQDGWEKKGTKNKNKGLDTRKKKTERISAHKT